MRKLFISRPALVIYALIIGFYVGGARGRYEGGRNEIHWKLQAQIQHEQLIATCEKLADVTGGKGKGIECYYLDPALTQLVYTEGGETKEVVQYRKGAKPIECPLPPEKLEEPVFPTSTIRDFCKPFLSPECWWERPSNGGNAD